METCFWIRRGEEPLHFKPGEGKEFFFEAPPGAREIYFTGETALFYQWKSEPDIPETYLWIDDSLNSRVACRDQYCLELEGAGESFPRLAYHKVMFPPELSYLPLTGDTDHWELGLWVRTRKVTLEPGGYLRFRAEIREKRSDLAAGSTNRQPDQIAELPIPLGDNGWTRLSVPVNLSGENTDSVAFVLEGEGFRGTVWAERPEFLSREGRNLLPPFAPNAPGRPRFSWTGVNLSQKEWPVFRLSLNGQEFFRGPLFERCHRQSENTVALDTGLLRPGTNCLRLELVSQYREALAYDLYSLGLLCREEPFLACPEVVTAGESFSLAVEARKGTAFRVEGPVVPIELEPAPEDGLHLLRLVCLEPGNEIAFTLYCGEEPRACHIRRCVLREPDGVLTGTGDMVYIPAHKQDLERYLMWYLEENVGDLITLRPTYRWCGTRALDPALWTRTAALLNRAGLHYAHMLDGRELPGCDANPDPQTLAGPGFLGRQTHEFDGRQLYWTVRRLTPETDSMADLFLRRFRTHGAWMDLDYTPENMMETGTQRQMHRDSTVPPDMEAAAKAMVAQLRRGRRDALRHTGPTTTFRYFYQAGYEWTGAELMYGPLEPVAAALRGAARCYGKPATGAHLALQWSTTPHDTPQRYLRYRLALFLCWMQEIREINTEEGLWHLEEYYAAFDRFSQACRMHLAQQQDFQRYVRTHSRSGHFYTPVAFLQGRFDGWRCFGRNRIWGREDFPFAEPEEAWDLLNWFYPRAKMDLIYRHGCENQSHGFYSGTPWGNVDILPVEQKEFQHWPLLAMPGYNKALPEDFDRLESYVMGGGILILGWPQCAVTTDRTRVTALRHDYLAHPFTARFLGEPSFRTDSFRGCPVQVAQMPEGAEPLLLTDEGGVMAYRVRLGQGAVVVVNAREYAGAPGVRVAWESVLEQTIPEILCREPVWARGNENVQFALYRQTDGSSHIYFIATDWYRDPRNPRFGTLCLGKARIPVPAPLGTPCKVVVRQGRAAWALETENDILELTQWGIRVQGVGKGRFCLWQEGECRTLEADFSEESIQWISCRECPGQ